ncbi:HTH-type transcriptional regulator ArgP [Trinickia symbiotica]|nr:HTH-type transcriptional regulator ArgP [Trinickia symbiotica]
MIQLETFATVVEYRNFTRAAEALNISRGVPSRRVIDLEETLGTRLLIREPMLAPTKAGEEVLRYYMSVRLLHDALLRRVVPGSVATTAVALAVNADSLATWFGPVARELARRHVALELVVDDQDHTLEALARGDVKGCLSTQRKAVDGFVAEPVGQMRYQCVATPRFMAEHFADGVILQKVLKATAVLFNRKDTLHDIFLESRFGMSVSRYLKHYFPSPTALLDAILDDLGYGLVPAMQADPLIQSGKLVAVAPGHDVPIDLYWHRWKEEPEPLAEISKLVVEAARRSLDQAGATKEAAGGA